MCECVFSQVVRGKSKIVQGFRPHPINYCFTLVPAIYPCCIHSTVSCGLAPYSAVRRLISQSPQVIGGYCAGLSELTHCCSTSICDGQLEMLSN